MKLKIAAYRWIGHPDWEPEVMIIRAEQDPDRPSCNYYRVSKVIEVEFPEISIEAQTERAFDGISILKSDAAKEFNNTMNRIKNFEAAHRLLTHDQPESL
jgi:hypothetical protein